MKKVSALQKPPTERPTNFIYNMEERGNATFNILISNLLTFLTDMEASVPILFPLEEKNDALLNLTEPKEP